MPSKLDRVLGSSMDQSYCTNSKTAGGEMIHEFGIPSGR
jgi:hypothetical protein